jgi:hypothetical protein
MWEEEGHNMPPAIIVNGLIVGAAVSVVLSILILGSVWTYPALWAAPYLPDIRVPFSSPSGPPSATRARTLVTVLAHTSKASTNSALL